MPFCPLRHTAMVLASNPVRLSAEATPFAGEACETSYHSLVRMESCWKEDSRNSCRTVRSHFTSF